jgi:sulfite reductase alpha subunit-like flavoprotein
MGFLEDHKTLVVATVAATGGALAFWTISSTRQRRQLNSRHPSTTTNDFDSFLRKPIANPSFIPSQANEAMKKKQNYAATSFEAYLKHTDSSAAAAAELSESTRAAANSATPLETAFDLTPCCPPEAKPVTILYGTEFGFSREIAEKLCQRIEKYTNNNQERKTNYWPELLNLADFPNGLCLEKCQVVLIACSTQGDGVPPTEVRDFCSWLQGATAPKLSSPDPTTAPTAPAVNFSVLALGDRSYTHFARCGKEIDARLEELGGTRFVPRVDVNKEDLKVVDEWIEAVVSELGNLNLKTAEELQWNGVLAYYNSSSNDSESNIIGSSSNGMNGSGYSTTAKSNKWTKSKPYFASIVGVESLCNLKGKATSHSLSPSTPTKKSNKSTSSKKAKTRTSQQTNGTNGSAPLSTNDNSTTKNNSTTNNNYISSNDKNTVCVEIDLGDSEIDYLPGDALGVWPRNDPQDVDDLLDAAGFRITTSDDDENYEKVLVKVPTWHYNDEEMRNVTTSDGNGSLQSSGLITVRDALTRCYDLKSPKPELLPLLAQKLKAHNNSSVSFVKRGNSGGTDEKYLAERHVADILRDFKPARLTVEELLGVLRQLQPRLYSISSSPLEDSKFKLKLSNGSFEHNRGDDEGEGRSHHRHHTVQLTVAVLKYTSVVGKSRVGVASTYLAERSQVSYQRETGYQNFTQEEVLRAALLPLQNSNIKVPVYLYKNPDFRLPSDLKTPIIMVGPGTGVAPFRGFIKHRILLAEAAAAAKAAAVQEKERNEEAVLGPALLFFGCRRRDQDYLYGFELEKWAEEGQIELFTAFSRETEKKIYVQHRLVENGSRVWQLLEAGAVFYVCGDGAHMAGDVETALKRVIEEYQGLGAAAAVTYYDTLVKSGRYKKDVWVS